MSLHRAVTRTKEVLLHVENLIAYRLTTTMGSGSSTTLRIDRSAWLRDSEQLHKAQKNIRDCRLGLSTAIGLLNAYVASREQNLRC